MIDEAQYGGRIQPAMLLLHLILILCIIGIVFLSLDMIGVYWFGDYTITRMWVGGNEYCENCLWIEFEDGCGLGTLYYFKNQHELDTRLEIGMPVDIIFNEGGFVSEVKPRHRLFPLC